jgi:hypothetical protein
MKDMKKRSKYITYGIIAGVVIGTMIGKVGLCIGLGVASGIVFYNITNRKLQK